MGLILEVQLPTHAILDPGLVELMGCGLLLHLAVKALDVLTRGLINKQHLLLLISAALTLITLALLWV